MEGNNAYAFNMSPAQEDVEARGDDDEGCRASEAALETHRKRNSRQSSARAISRYWNGASSDASALEKAMMIRRCETVAISTIASQANRLETRRSGERQVFKTRPLADKKKRGTGRNPA
ncbi:MAG: hypothetical protein M9908_06590 [Phyllobacteriaceae bacterium]|nr:hypothetical protein [Phyllobacteriaceae bacterium]